jgi:hypothetical protein
MAEGIIHQVGEYQEVRQCLTCARNYSSRNQLFKHLGQYPNHYKELKYSCSGSKLVRTREERIMSNIVYHQGLNRIRLTESA